MTDHKPTTPQGQKAAVSSPKEPEKQKELEKEFDKGLKKELEKKAEAKDRVPLRPNRPESRIRNPPIQTPFYELGEGSELYPLNKPAVEPRT